MAAQVITEHLQGALQLTLSNPGLRNALAPEMYETLLPALDAARNDPDIRAVIITGADGFFCAGGDLNRLQANRSKPRQVQLDSIDRLHAMTRAILACPKPIIAAVEGCAAGAGFSMALACDFIVAGISTKFVMAYVKVGLSPDGGASWFIARALPRQAAAEMLLAGEGWSSDRLYQFGVVNQVVADGSALLQARAWAARFRSLSPHAVSRIKRLAATAADTPLQTHLEAEQASFVECLHHPEAGEAIAAFLEKRSAKF